jgi:hypothetical protein
MLKYRRNPDGAADKNHEGHRSKMSISPVSNANPIPGSYETQNQQPPSKAPSSSDPPTDTVQFSQAAQAHLHGRDVDHDGDSH